MYKYPPEKLKSSKYYKEAEKKYQLKRLLTKHGYSDHILYLKDFIDTLKYLEKKHIPQIENFSCWIPIDSRELKKNVSGKEKTVTQITEHRRALYLITTEILTKIGIIKTDHSYCPKLFPKSFKFTDKYLPKKCVSTHKHRTKTLQIQKYLNRRLYRELYKVSPQPVSFHSSGLPSTDSKNLAEEEETTTTLTEEDDWFTSLTNGLSKPDELNSDKPFSQMIEEGVSLDEALEIVKKRLSQSETLSDYAERTQSKPVDLVPRHQTRLESSVVAVPDIVKKKIGIVLDKDFTDKGLLRETMYDLKSQAEMIIGIDNRRFSENIRKISDEFEIPHGEVLSDHHEYTTRSLRPLKEHNRKYFTFCWRERDKIFAEKVDRVIIFKHRGLELNKNSLYLMQELDRQGVPYEIKEN